ncbi:MAG: hypothetical protein PVS3B1_25280 [Ktedonobacteraceae bacterium]
MLHSCRHYHRSSLYNGSRSGLGLGLFIARKIVERHGGHIEVQSMLEHGSTFDVVLPIYVNPTGETGSDVSFVPHTQAVWTITH